MLFRNRMVIPMLCGAVALGACADAAPPTAATPEKTPVVAGGPSEARASDLASILAAGMAQADVRTAVRDAMRQSPYAEHKLVLQEWAATPEGARTVETIAAAAGVPFATLTGLVEQLPRMDFYVPFREQRMSWTGTSDVVVAVTMDQNRLEVTGVRPDGSTRRYRRTDGVPTSTVLMLHPAEAKVHRINRQPSRLGSVIQDRSDGELAAANLSVPDEDNCSEPYAVNCGGSGGTGGTGTASGTYFDGFWFTYEADTEWGDEEIEFRTQLKSSSGVIAGRTLRYEGVNQGDGARYYDKFDRLYTQRVSSGQWISMSVYETDFGTDDYFGTQLFHYSDFATGLISGEASKNYTTAFACGPQYSLCESIRVTADVRVTPWP